jgi:hypothetical protein
MSAVEPLDTDVYLDARSVRRRYGSRSDMALWRWVRDPNLAFPKPIYIQKFRILAARRSHCLGAKPPTRANF